MPDIPSHPVTDSDGATAVEQLQDTPAGPPDGEPLLRAEGVWKVFGPGADKIVGTPDAELSRAELREKTGCVIAVRDVSIEIKPGEVLVFMGCRARASRRWCAR
jgi:glycine betaine/proline transport system ATP-binding protein